LPSCSGPDNANAIVVKQQATVPLIFGGRKPEPGFFSNNLIRLWSKLA
jgi:hypothetical protein